MGTNLTGDEVVFVSADARQSHVPGSATVRSIEPQCNVGQSLSLDLLHGRRIAKPSREEIDVVGADTFAQDTYREYLASCRANRETAPSGVVVQHLTCHAIHEVLAFVHVLGQEQAQTTVDACGDRVWRVIRSHFAGRIIPWVHLPSCFASEKPANMQTLYIPKLICWENQKNISESLKYISITYGVKWT